MRLPAVVALLAGCGSFSPDIPVGLACSEGRDCPPDQVCDPATLTCEIEVSRPGLVPDAGVDVDIDAEPPSLPPATHVGVVRAYQGFEGVESYFVDFIERDDRECSFREQGECTVRICEPIERTKLWPDLGTIVVSSGATEVAMPYDNGSYAQIKGPTVDLLWPTDLAQSRQIEVTGAGAELPAFTARVNSTSGPTLFFPDMFNNVITVDRLRSLMFSWSVDELNGTGGVVHTQLVASEPAATGNRLIHLMCNFPEGAGQGTIPATVMRELPAEPVGQYFSIEHRHSTRIRPNEQWELEIRALSMLEQGGVRTIGFLDIQ
jgi:hypothetical protein